MSFELRVEFAGICLYLIHPDTERVAVVMPDCRRNKVDVLEHLDKDPAAEPHAGYLRFDLACLGGVLPGVTPGGGTGAPPYEGIHRFDMQEVDFGLGAAGSIDTDDKHFVLPDFRRFAPDLEPRPDLFAANPGTPPLMRMVLRGGKMRGLGRRNWKVSKFPESSGDEHVGFFAGHVVWTRPVEGTDELPLTIRGFDKTGGVR
ncbi:MAG TPA: hypothetical protein VK399_16240, partial [Longimicrobiaceae bacterium]|nr:hypothetical protein [Longimicrobiaceae bacterium]